MANHKKPKKPYKDFPLTPHRNGQWCKKINGRIHYFGPWADPQAALDLYQEQREDLYAGRSPRISRDSMTLGWALDHFLSSKALLKQSGEIAVRTYHDYEGTCERIANSLGKRRAIASITSEELQKLRRDLARGKRGPRSAGTLRNDLQRTRSVFLHINECLQGQIIYRKPLRSPERRLIRAIANERGPRMFEADEINAMIERAGQPLKAMIYLGINCAFGNRDCGTLPLAKLDLDEGWHTYGRPKTHTKRECPLWPETIEAIKDALAGRPEPASSEVAGLVFLTHTGECWSKESGDNALSSEFRKLLKEIGIYRPWVTTFYSLRRTFETIGATAGEQIAVDYVMGHIRDDMASVYRQKQFREPLRKVTNHVRDWLTGRKKIE